MILIAEFPNDISTGALAEQKDIPCTIQISKDFEVIFNEHGSPIRGLVLEWDRKLVDERAMAGAGGKYTHYAAGLITLAKKGANQYRIVDLSLFNKNCGWCPVLKDGEYATPNKKLWGSEEELFL